MIIQNDLSMAQYPFVPINIQYVTLERIKYIHTEWLLWDKNEYCKVQCHILPGNIYVILKVQVKNTDYK